MKEQGQDSDPEKTLSIKLIERLSMYTETLCEKIVITKDFLRGNSCLSSGMALLSYWKFSKNDQTAGFIFAGISCTLAFSLTLGLIILSKQQKNN